MKSTSPKQNIRKGLIAKIKIAQAALGLDDATYRALLMRVAGVRSCTEASVAQLEEILGELKRHGFMPVSRHRAPNRRTSADAMMRKVEAILADNALPWNYAHAVAKRMFGVDRVEWLGDENLHKLVAALQIYANRRKGGQYDAVTGEYV